VLNIGPHFFNKVGEILGWSVLLHRGPPFKQLDEATWLVRLEFGNQSSLPTPEYGSRRGEILRLCCAAVEEWVFPDHLLKTSARSSDAFSHRAERMTSRFAPETLLKNSGPSHNRWLIAST